MAWLGDKDLKRLGFRALGHDVLISEKASIYNADQIEIGDFSRVDDFCVLSGKISLGRNVHVAVFCSIAGGTPGVSMADFSGLAYGCKIFSQSDDYSGETLTNPTVPDLYKRETKESVHIGRHAILGTNAVVFPGVTVAEGCAVGANAVVTMSTEPWGIYVGSPARRVKSRKKALLELETKYLCDTGGKDE